MLWVVLWRETDPVRKEDECRSFGQSVESLLFVPGGHCIHEWQRQRNAGASEKRSSR